MVIQLIGGPSDGRQIDIDQEIFERRVVKVEDPTTPDRPLRVSHEPAKLQNFTCSTYFILLNRKGFFVGVYKNAS
jgi:hypothetical protein